MAVVVRYDRLRQEHAVYIDDEAYVDKPEGGFRSSISRFLRDGYTGMPDLKTNVVLLTIRVAVIDSILEARDIRSRACKLGIYHCRRTTRLLL